MNDSLGDRMKYNYEDRTRFFLTRRIPVILRLDGKAFHTLTKGCKKPFDTNLRSCMLKAASAVFSEIQGAKLAYIQSDEISILITDYSKIETQAWFDYNVQKMCSVSSAIASSNFSMMFSRYGYFDCRVFNIPKEEVCNYFIWRQKDWIRNSVSMLTRSHYSHKEMNGKTVEDMHEMLHKKEVNWTDLDGMWKNGTFVKNVEGKGPVCFNDIILTENREFAEDLI